MIKQDIFSMKIKNVIGGVLLAFMISCSSTSNIQLQKLPSADDIAYILVEIDLDEEVDGENETIYDVDENGNVAVVESGTKEDTGRNKYKELFRITDPKVISSLVEKLKQNTKGEANVTFSWTLPSAIFFNKQGSPAFSVNIICDDSSVFINQQIIAIDEKEKIITFDTEGKDIASGINKPYVKAYFDILKKKAPGEVKILEKRYKNQGGVEKLLFP